MWGKLGYPRRALRLHACAVAIEAERHGGQVPDALAELLALPGVGDYTARAVLAFAFGRRAPVVDINVRRVLARAIAGQAQPGPPSTRRDLAAMQQLLPAADAAAARFSAATMELGALVCTAAQACLRRCPIADGCAWRLAGYPAYSGPVSRPQRFTGTDRQVRGLLLDVLRAADRPGLPGRAGPRLAGTAAAAAGAGFAGRRRPARPAAGRPVRAAVLTGLAGRLVHAVALGQHIMGRQSHIMRRTSGPAMEGQQMGKTLAEKVWDAHVVRRADGRARPALHRPAPGARGDQPAGLRGAAAGRPPGPPAGRDASPPRTTTSRPPADRPQPGR